MGSTHRVAVIPGDGIGQEVVPAALTVIEAVAARSGFHLDLVEFPYGMCDSRQARTDDGRRRIRVPLGVRRHLPWARLAIQSVPDHVSVWELILPLRQRFDQDANLRPIRLFPGITSPLANRGPPTST